MSEFGVELMTVSILDDLMGITKVIILKRDNISSVKKWVIQRKINMNKTYLLHDQASI